MYLLTPTLLLLVLSMMIGCSTPATTPKPLNSQEIALEKTIQLQKAFQYQLGQRARLAEVAYPLLKENLSACGKQTRYTLGLLLHNIEDYPATHKEAIRALLNTNQKIQVLHTLNYSSALGTLKQGDILISANNIPIPEDTSKALKLINSQLQQDPTIIFEIMRGNSEIRTTITASEICNYPVHLSHSNTINGYANGSQITITQGLMRFAKEDSELAFIIAHEMAHNTEQHIPQRLKNSSLGALLDMVLISSGIPSPLISTGIAANLYSQSYEIEADIIGLRLMHRAGYPIKQIDKFWRKMAAVHPATILKGQEISHPTTVERSLFIKKEIDILTATLPKQD